MAAAHPPARCATGVTALLQGGIDTCVYPGAVWALGDPAGSRPAVRSDSSTPPTRQRR